MTKAEARAFLMEYKLYEAIDLLVPTLLEYSPDNRERRGAVQDVIIRELDLGSSNKIRNMVTLVLKKKGILPIKYQGSKCYKNVRIKRS